jgi:hypothetical protein
MRDSDREVAIRASLERFEVPEHLHEGLVNYLVFRIEPGHFLCEVLANNLRGAFERGDRAALDGLEALVSWLYNEAPSSAWGSREAIDAWLAT